MKAKPKILVIDNNPEKLLFLPDFGYEVKFITNGKEALEYIGISNDHFNLVIINLNLTFVSGWEILRLLRKCRNFEVKPVIIMTDRYEKTDEILALRTGADHFTGKNFDIDILLARIEVLLRRSYWNQKSFISITDLLCIEPSDGKETLTSREQTILCMLSKGKNNNEIASELCLSNLTVKTHIKNLFKKLNATNRTEAVLIGINLGLLQY